MSLEQFNQMSVKSKEEEDEGPEYQIMPSAPKPNTSLPKDAQPDKDYFKKVDQDVQKIIQQEHIQEEYRKVWFVIFITLSGIAVSCFHPCSNMPWDR